MLYTDIVFCRVYDMIHGDFFTYHEVIVKFFCLKQISKLRETDIPISNVIWYHNVFNFILNFS